ncbi:MAG: GntR family transcriptional regulator [Dehalococcoidales bacterium]
MPLQIPPLRDVSEHRTMRQVVVEKVRQGITQGRLTPGQKLVYSDLAREINVSVTPVREAMKTLEALGLVTIRPYRTAYVSYLTADEIEQIYVLRKLLEGLATRAAAERTSREELSHLRRVVEAKGREISVLTASDDDTVRSNIIVSLQRLHDEFHMGLYAASGDKYLCHLIGLLRSQLSTYFPVINRYSISRVNEAHREHLDILIACEQRNPALAERLMQEHLSRTVAVLLEHIKSNPPQSDVAGNEADEGNGGDIADTVDIKIRKI